MAKIAAKKKGKGTYDEEEDDPGRQEVGREVPVRDEQRDADAHLREADRGADDLVHVPHAGKAHHGHQAEAAPDLHLTWDARHVAARELTVPLLFLGGPVLLHGHLVAHVEVDAKGNGVEEVVDLHVVPQRGLDQLGCRKPHFVLLCKNTNAQLTQKSVANSRIWIAVCRGKKKHRQRSLFFSAGRGCGLVWEEGQKGCACAKTDFKSRGKSLRTASILPLATRPGTCTRLASAPASPPPTRRQVSNTAADSLQAAAA